jgi:FlaA1/EpsC-like NDP-sugar epimerase
MNNIIKSFFNFTLYLFVWTISSILAILFRYDFKLSVDVAVKILPSLFLFILTFYVIGYFDRKIFGLPSKSSFEEFFSFSRKFLITGFVCFIFLLIYPNFILPKSYPILASILSLGFYAIVNKLAKFYYQKILIKNSSITVAIYGAGMQGQLLLQKILNDQTLDWKPIVIFDDNSNLKITRLNGIKVVTGVSLPTLFKKYNLKILIVSFSQISNIKLQEIQEICNNHDVQLLIISPIKAITGKEFSISDIRKPTQEELIGKSSIKADYNLVKAFISGKVVLVTGAGGSIGSELARQINSFNPKELYLLDRDESGLLEVSLSLNIHDGRMAPKLVLADIRDEVRISDLIAKIKPQIIFHAAALKHLNILEMYPEEAFKTNLIGTNTLLKEAAKNGVMTFVNVSTDKAADPISVLGKTKLIAEKLTAGYSSSNSDTEIRFLSVRFGNVFGSRGSVIHTFLKQIEQGGPVTITDPMVKRYFMTIEDAVHLVLRAATQGESGDTLILRMGDPVPIMDIANKLIKSSGKEIKLQFTSLRPGEKLNELLVGKNEKILESNYSEIMRVKVDPISWENSPKSWQELIKIFDDELTDQN